MKAAVGATLLSALCVAATNAAYCPCGFQDPSTNALWTDSIITYFNESAAKSTIALRPSRAPSIDGSKSGGDTGNSSVQDWAAVNHLNDYNDGFSNLWRTGYAANNTHMPDQDTQDGERWLQMDVQPADLRDRITWGSALLTRRRDIQFGSLRASLKAPDPYQGGTILQFGLQYNSTEYIRSSVYSASSGPAQSSLQWSYSARNADANPYAQNLSIALGPSPWSRFVEHRIDWLGSQELMFSSRDTSSSNDAISTLALRKERDHTNLPSLGGPVSLEHFSAGDSSLLQSPPTQHQPSAGVLYARLFFNSSLPLRQNAFEAGCAATPDRQVCSTEDPTLRGSTPFSEEALRAVVVPSVTRKVPRYSIIACSAAAGMFMTLLLHALVIRSLSKQATLDSGVVSEQSDPRNQRRSESHAADRGRISTDPARWEDPDLHNFEQWDNEDEEQDHYSSDGEDEYESHDDPLRIDRRAMTLESFGHGSFSGSHGSGYVAPLYSSLAEHHAADASAWSDSGKFSASHQTLESKEVLADHSQADAIPMLLRDSGRLYPGRPGSLASSDATMNRQLSFSADLPVGAPGPSGGGFAGVGQGKYAVQDAMHPKNSSFVVNLVEQRRAVRWETPIVEWQPSIDRDALQSAGQMAQRKDSCGAARPMTPAQAAAGSFNWLKRFLQVLFVGEGAGGKTASGAARVEYLDGLRGFACFLVSFHHFMLIFYYGMTTAGQPMHYPGLETWLRRILGAVLVNGGLNVGIFFCLAARVIANRYLVRGRLQDLAEAIHRRVPRLMLPISAAIVINYFLIEADAFHWVQRLASRTWSPWSYYQDYANLGVFINDYLSLWFTVPPNVPPLISLYATGILWTVPVIVQSSWTVFLCALIAREIPSASKRYAFYATCWALSWYANRFDYFFLAGLIIADLDNRLKYRQKAAEGFPLAPKLLRARLPDRIAGLRVHGQVFAWVVFLSGAVMSWLEFIGGPGSDVIVQEYGIHPDLTSSQPNSWTAQGPTYTDPRFFDFLFVVGFFLLCDLCTPFRTFFQLRFWSSFGRNAFSLYLLHGVIFWSWGAWLCLKLLTRDVPYWATVSIVFVTSYLWLALLCEMFTRTFDSWGVGISKASWRATSGGLGQRN